MVMRNGMALPPNQRSDLFSAEKPMACQDAAHEEMAGLYHRLVGGRRLFLPCLRMGTYSNSLLTDSLRWMRLIASARSGAILSTTRLGSCLLGGTGMLSVTTT